MEKDPQQFTNLAGVSAYKDLVNSFKEKLKNKLSEVRTNDLNINYN